MKEGFKKIVDDLKADQLILLENLRFQPEETANDYEFSQSLATYFDIYINDAL
jgi:phosphoglycerate kinase